MSSCLRSIGQIHVTVSDIDRSVNFYRDVLGLPLLFRVEGQPMAFFDVGGIRLYLGEPERPQFRSTPLIYFRVDDIRLTYDDLRRKGVPFAGDPRVVHREGASELWMAFFTDPDGTTLAIMSGAATST